jgi:hypothetical protein
MTVAIVVGIAGPVLAIGIAGTLFTVQGFADKRVAQGCADSAALAAAATGDPAAGRSYGSVNGCPDTSIDFGATITATASYGRASARAVAMADPVRLIQ